MNRHVQTNLLLAVSALAPAAALIVAWLAVARADSNQLLLQFSAVSIVLALVGVCASIIMARAGRGQFTALRCLDLLSRMDDDAWSQLSTQPQRLGLEPNSPWHDVLTRLSTRFSHLTQRLQEAEMARAGLELKARRRQEQLEQIERILAGLADPVLACNGYDEVLVANPSAERLLGFELANTETRALAQLTRCQELLDLLDDTKRRKSSTHRSREIELNDAAGRTHWYRVTASALHRDTESSAADQANRRVVAVFRDISGEREIQKRNAEFVSAASHEMKTPLAGIKAYVELLADGDAEDDETRDEFLSVIDGQADRLRRLVDNLLNIARIEAGVVAVGKECQSLNEILEEALRVIQPSAEAKQLTLHRELSPMYLSVHADRDMLLQAAINLLSNAVKYTPAGRNVTLRSRLDNAEALFEVEDEGVGLSPEDQQRVFEKFYRVKKDKDMAAGTGLGLPLAKHIVEDVHGGSLTVTSELGRGSTFRISLPAAARVTSHH